MNFTYYYALARFIDEWILLAVMVGIGLLALIGIATLSYLWIVWTFLEIIEEDMNNGE